MQNLQGLVMPPLNRLALLREFVQAALAAGAVPKNSAVLTFHALELDRGAAFRTVREFRHVRSIAEHGPLSHGL